MDFLELAKKRYSVREFSSKKVEKEKILKILESAKIAPTAKNTQPIKIYYCTDDEKLKLLNESSPCEYNSQLMFVITYNLDECWYNSHTGIPSGIVDATIASTHMVLEAEDLGLGSVYIGAFNPEIVKEKFDIPKQNQIAMLLFMGYKAESSEPSDMHETFKSDEELFEELKIR